MNEDAEEFSAGADDAGFDCAPACDSLSSSRCENGEDFNAVCVTQAAAWADDLRANEGSAGFGDLAACALAGFAAGEGEEDS